MKQNLILWDSIDKPIENKGLVYTWNGHAERGSIRSLLQYVESHGEQLRRKYLAFIHDLGEVQVRGKRVVEYFEIGDDFSLWWMSLQAEKSIWKSPNIGTVIRIFALEEIVLNQKIDKLILVSANKSLHKVLEDFCQNLGISYEWERLSDASSKKLSLNSIYRALPHLLQALIGLTRHLLARWPLRKTENPAWFKGSRSLFFCSYFVQLVAKPSDEDPYYSSYWGDLCVLMRRLGYSGNWLQHYIPCDAVTNPKVALGWVGRFNKRRVDQGFHTFLDSFLSWRIVLRVLRRWVSLLGVFWHLSNIKRSFRPKGSRLFLWPLMEEDWRSSVIGRIAIDNLLWIELFDNALRNIPHQRKGFYLCENIAWERALIRAWRKHGHGQLIAVVHGVIRFWDMRYFHDSRTIRSLSPFSIPQPDLTVLNGRAAVEAYSKAGYSKDFIVEGEALRNGYLHDLRSDFSSRKKNGGPIKVLILGDFSHSGTTKMLKLLEESVLQVSDPITFTMKPHPLSPVKSSDYPSLSLKVTMDPLEKIMGDYDIAYSTDLTSAVVDAYLVGLPVIVVLGETELNLSPLRGRPDVPFVSTPNELGEALQMLSENLTRKSVDNDFFFLDPELPRWQKLLQVNSS